MTYAEQLEKIKFGNGFIAALDQSGGSTPKALAQYGIPENEYADEADMFKVMHDMRVRIITAPAFHGSKIIGAILFEKTMDDTIKGVPTAQYLWNKLGIVPFLKIDKGLMDEQNGSQLMKPISSLESLLSRAKEGGIFGTKMRSVINAADEKGIQNLVNQQFDVASIIIKHGLVPIIEPEINIKAKDKAVSEEILKSQILQHLDALLPEQYVMLKLTLPEQANFYHDLVRHPNVLRVVALSGGYTLEQACRRLAENRGVIASFSRALTNDLRISQNDTEFNNIMSAVIDRIYAASVDDEDYKISA